MKRLTLCVVTLLLVGCSSRGTYDSIQDSGKRECARQPPGAYESCMERYGLDYDEYERERSAL
ncbi:hypothetical protein [Marinobacter bohaiensis]|uniref:hypothetical protein n=1 Tax=Marinobacter bohaiensis TaxID=2201898 RepID=UPI000DABD7BB|nr:hypothetical protein [Marinobacter bohaiensis]